MKTKIFIYEIGNDEDIKEAQKDINKWLQKNSTIDILEFKPSYKDEEYHLTILYKHPKEGLERFTESN